MDHGTQGWLSGLLRFFLMSVCSGREAREVSDCANLVIRRYDDESSDYSNLPNYLTTIYGL